MHVLHTHKKDPTKKVYIKLRSTPKAREYGQGDVVSLTYTHILTHTHTHTHTLSLSLSLTLMLTFTHTHTHTHT